MGHVRLSATPSELTAAVRTRALDLGFDLVGFGPVGRFEEQELILGRLAGGYLAGMDWITPQRVVLSCDPESLLPGARTVVALGTSYVQVEGPDRPVGLVGRVARYARGRDYHDVISPRLQGLADSIVELAGSGTRCRTFVDTGPLVERAAARRAGLGFVGKNTCVLTGRHGSFVFLSAVLTTAELVADPIVTRDCGSCRACIDACPTEALVRPNEMDATRCISYLTIEHRGSIPEELRPKVGTWVFGCDVCQDVCPWNQARPPAAHPEFASAAGAGANLDLTDLFGLEDAGFRARFRGTPLTRAKREGLLRNAAVVLGNLADPSAGPALTQALSDQSAVVREHVAWALGRVSRGSPAIPAAPPRALAGETDPAARSVSDDSKSVGRKRA